MPRLAPRPSTRRSGRRIAVVAAACALLLAACGDGDSEPAATGATSLEPGTPLSITEAHFDLAVGEDQRVLAGVFTPDRQLVAFGEVTFQLAYLGPDLESADEEAPIDQEVTAPFLPVAGMQPAATFDTATLVSDPESQGVYAGRVDLDEPGVYGLRVVAELDGEQFEGRTTFLVQAEPEVLVAGDQAPRSENLTIADVEAGTATPVSVDSRAQGEDAEIPDPHLHDTTVAASLEAERPVLVGITTPVYCASRFCGPLTSVLSELAFDYEDRVDVIHIEVWEDFDEQQLNAAAAEWIQTEAGGNEPWVFLVDGDGTVLARWDNVLDTEELIAELDELPVIGPRATATGS
ncbi:MAG: hypothetical protein JJT89_04530 [Nitriliruptoraceae bacterium]|nr:hypothetical protein [Nitriliruptoraceae bacterium]